MGGCVGSTPAADSSPIIVDVEQAIANKAWRMFYMSLSRWQRLCIRRKDFSIEVPINYFHFQVTDQQFFDVANEKKKHKDPKQNGTQVQSGLTGREMAHTSQTSPEHIGLETDFKNSTGEKQTYNFKCEKTRKATMTVTYQKGFSIGGKANFSLGLPKVLSDGKTSAEIDMRVSVTKTTGETFEQTLTTCATSDITVGPYTHCKASVAMEERHLLADFKVWVTMSMPAQEARAFIKNQQGDTIFYYTLYNLSKLFSEETHLKDEKGSVRSDAVEFVMEGRVDGMQMSNHHINLTERSLRDQAVAEPPRDQAVAEPPQPEQQ